MAKLDIRKIPSSNLEACFYLFQEDYLSPWQQEALGAFFHQISPHFLGGYMGQNLIACLILQISLPEAEIIDFVVQKALRNKGIGRQLLSFGLTYCKNQGAQQVTLEVESTNQQAIHLYKSFNFSESGFRKAYYTPPGKTPLDAFILSKAL